MKIINDDILSNINPGVPTFILHGCNCFHTMGAGIAKYLASKYPEIRKVDKETPYGKKYKIGTFSKAEVEPNLTIYNCYTQFRYGRGKHFESAGLALCLVAIRDELVRKYVYLNSIDIRSPMIGCGLGGDDWENVKIIYEILFPEIVIYNIRR